MKELLLQRYVYNGRHLKLDQRYLNEHYPSQQARVNSKTKEYAYSEGTSTKDSYVVRVSKIIRTQLAVSNNQFIGRLEQKPSQAVTDHYVGATQHTHYSFLPSFDGASSSSSSCSVSVAILFSSTCVCKMATKKRRELVDPKKLFRVRSRYSNLL